MHLVIIEFYFPIFILTSKLEDSHKVYPGIYFSAVVAEDWCNIIAAATKKTTHKYEKYNMAKHKYWNVLRNHCDFTVLAWLWTTVITFAFRP